MAKGKGKKGAGGKKNVEKVSYTYGTPTPGAGTRISTRGVASESALTHAMLNPWAPEARGVKIPDDDSAQSIALTVTDFYLLSGVTNNKAINISPSLSGTYRESNVITNTQVTSWSPAHPSAGTPLADYTAIAAGLSTFRIVSWGVKVIPLMAPTNASGTIRIITEAVDPTTGAFNTTGGLFVAVEDFPVANTTPHWVSKPVGTTWKQYKDIASFGDWQNCTVVINGAASSVQFRIEVVFNLEAQIVLGSLTGAINTPAANHNPRVMMAADHGRNNTKNAHHHNTVWDTLKNGAVKGLSYAMEMFGPPLLNRVTQKLLGSTPRMPMLTNGGGPTILEVD